MAGHKLVQQGAVRLGDAGVQQRGGRDHQHLGRLGRAGEVKAQAEVAVRHPAGHQDLAVGVRAELRHWPRSWWWMLGHQATRPDQDVDIKQPGAAMCCQVALRISTSGRS